MHRIDLDRRDRTTVGGIPSTGVARTLLDCAGISQPGRLVDLVDASFCSGLSHPTAVHAMIERIPPTRARQHAATLLTAIEDWTPGIRPGSPAEMRLLRQIRDWGFSAPECQIDVVDASGGFIGRIDLGGPLHKVGLEYDGDRFHNPRHWDRDEQRQLQYAAAGWTVRRVDKYDLRAGQEALREALHRLLSPVAA